MVASLPCVCAKDPIDAWAASAVTDTCSDRYNSLVAGAKAALISGDQRGALHGLLAAKSQLRLCEERDRENATGAVAIALNAPCLTDCCR
jgi:hypothetical protein